MADYIVLLAFILSAIPILLLFLRKQLHDFKNELSAIKPFLWLLFIGAVYEIVFTHILRIPSSVWFTLYTLLEFMVLWYFFYKLLNYYSTYLKTALLLIVIISTVALFYWEYEKHAQIEGYLAIPVSIFIFTSSVLWFKSLFKAKDVIPLIQLPSFYFISGLVIYFAGTVFVSLIIYQLKLITGFYEKYWLVFVIVSYIMRIMMAVGVWKATEKSRIWKS